MGRSKMPPKNPKRGGKKKAAPKKTKKAKRKS